MVSCKVTAVHLSDTEVRSKECYLGEVLKWRILIWLQSKTSWDAFQKAVWYRVIQVPSLQILTYLAQGGTQGRVVEKFPGWKLKAFVIVVFWVFFFSSLFFFLGEHSPSGTYTGNVGWAFGSVSFPLAYGLQTHMPPGLRRPTKMTRTRSNRELELGLFKRWQTFGFLCETSQF